MCCFTRQRNDLSHCCLFLPLSVGVGLLTRVMTQVLCIGSLFGCLGGLNVWETTQEETFPDFATSSFLVTSVIQIFCGVACFWSVILNSRRMAAFIPCAVNYMKGSAIFGIVFQWYYWLAHKLMLWPYETNSSSLISPTTADTRRIIVVTLVNLFVICVSCYMLTIVSSYAEVLAEGGTGFEGMNADDVAKSQIRHYEDDDAYEDQ
ncbi:MAG: hypothetical protein KVP17_004466 [Porospora cf. gigantea B]|uniref:uncharacterized protein n=1 Tax=Porospora cf. gigantea B TaxID=2853592 RepID=UPI003571924B|nr:MAG: hypothetical protein KVP17_004466 [Porospora cf. gigantea B]